MSNQTGNQADSKPIQNQTNLSTPTGTQASQSQQDSDNNQANKARKSRDDPSNTAGIPNSGWLLLFVVLALTPLASAVKNWTTPYAMPHQMTRSAPDQSQSSAGKSATEIEQKLSALGAKVDELKDTEKRLSVLEARLDDTYSTVEAVGFSAGLFGVLITVITLFFALKESERVKDAMNRLESVESDLEDLENIRLKAESAKEDANHGVRTVREALRDARQMEERLIKLSRDITDRGTVFQSLQNEVDGLRQTVARLKLSGSDSGETADNSMPKPASSLPVPTSTNEAANTTLDSKNGELSKVDPTVLAVATSS